MVYYLISVFYKEAHVVCESTSSALVFCMRGERSKNVQIDDASRHEAQIRNVVLQILVYPK